MITLRTDLRTVPTLTGTAPTFDLDDLPADPTALFVDWFDTAVDAGVTEPAAMTLSTVDAAGRPDARVLIMKRLSPDGRWGFAGNGRSAKGDQLTACPAAALTFWWSPLVRSVRLRGPVVRATRDESAQDFATRSLPARAVATAGPTSRPLDDLQQQDDAVDRAKQALEAGDPTTSDWTLWWLRPHQVEFWQGSPDRQHRRVQYRRDDCGWRHRLLWS